MHLFFIIDYREFSEFIYKWKLLIAEDFYYYEDYFIKIDLYSSIICLRNHLKLIVNNIVFKFHTYLLKSKFLNNYILIYLKFSCKFV